MIDRARARRTAYGVRARGTISSQANRPLFVFVASGRAHARARATDAACFSSRFRRSAPRRRARMMFANECYQHNPVEKACTGDSQMPHARARALLPTSFSFSLSHGIARTHDANPSRRATSSFFYFSLKATHGRLLSRRVFLRSIHGRVVAVSRIENSGGSAWRAWFAFDALCYSFSRDCGKALANAPACLISWISEVIAERCKRSTDVIFFSIRRTFILGF